MKIKVLSYSLVISEYQYGRGGQFSDRSQEEEREEKSWGRSRIVTTTYLQILIFMLPLHCPSTLTLMLLVAYLANTKWCRRPEKLLKPWHMGTHPRVPSESSPINTNMTGFRWFLKIYVFLCFGQSSLSIGRVDKKITDIDPRASPPLSFNL